MGILRQACIVAVALAFAEAGGDYSCLGRCGIALNTGSVGSCMFSSCSESRGPTHCTFGSCYCNDNYCRYPVTTLHIQSRTCRMRAGDDTCHASRFCYNSGLTTTSCSGGLCFCSFGYVYNCETKQCEEDNTNALLPFNATQEQLAEFAHHVNESNRESLYNVLTAGLWVCAAFVVMIGGVFVLRRLRKAKVEAAEYTLLE